MQFSLRMMLVLVTVLCVALSIWIVPAERQRRAVAAIVAHDGTVYEEEVDETFLITLLQRWLPRDYFVEVHRIDLVIPN